jgi:hypothetical protein
MLLIQNKQLPHINKVADFKQTTATHFCVGLYPVCIELLQFMELSCVITESWWSNQKVRGHALSVP